MAEHFVLRIIKSLEIRYEELKERWENIQSDIKKAQRDGDYLKMIDLCNEALSINNNDKEIKDLLINTKQKVKSQKLNSFIVKATTMKKNGDLVGALDLLNEALELDSANETISTLKYQIEESVSQIQKEVGNFEKEIIKKESIFDYKSAIELCNQLIVLDIANKNKWSEELQRLQSLQIEKSDLELNFRRKKADIKVLIRNNDLLKAEDQINSMRKRCHEFGINSHDKEFSDLLLEIHPERKETLQATTKIKVGNPIKKPESRKRKVIVDSPKEQVGQSPKIEKKEFANNNSELNNEGFLLLQTKKYVQAKRYFALQKNKTLAEICTILIKLEKSKQLGIITREESEQLNAYYQRFNITL